MTGWDVLNEAIKNFPPLAATVLFIVAGVIFIIGFSRYGANFIKYGFSQKELGDLGKKIDKLGAEFKSELETLKVNHFGHLKDFLTEITSILLDKGILNNQDKARLDNKLRGM